MQENSTDVVQNKQVIKKKKESHDKAAKTNQFGKIFRSFSLIGRGPSFSAVCLRVYLKHNNSHMTL